MPAKKILEEIKKLSSHAAQESLAQPAAASKTPPPATSAPASVAPKSSAQPAAPKIPLPYMSAPAPARETAAKSAATPSPATPASVSAIPETTAQAVPSKTATPATQLPSPAAPASAPAQMTPFNNRNKAAGVTSSGTCAEIGAVGGSAEQSITDIKESAPPRVFLSYQSAFTTRVLQLKRALEERGIPCWMAYENMVGNVQDAIGQALMVAPAIIICYSHSYRESMYASKFKCNTLQSVKYDKVGRKFS